MIEKFESHILYIDLQVLFSKWYLDIEVISLECYLTNRIIILGLRIFSIDWISWVKYQNEIILPRNELNKYYVCRI